jgi:hypothetical protein
LQAPFVTPHHHAAAISDNGILQPVSETEEILRTCHLLIRPGDVHEVRIPKTHRHGTISGYFDTPDELARAVLRYDGNVPAVYITLNPCKPALLARAKNRLQVRAVTTTNDCDIVRRRWLLIDCDPVRPAGISASSAEHGRAMSVACSVWDELRSIGFPDPVCADSGNGAHLLYSINMPNDAQTTELIGRVLRGINERCGTDDVAIDQSVSNAARITKLYGTKVCKGDDLSDRPHRRSRLLEIPEHLTEVWV